MMCEDWDEGEEDLDEVWVFEFLKSASDVTTFWRGASSRYRVFFVMVFVFIVCNMDKVNILVVIIFMVWEFGWMSM